MKKSLFLSVLSVLIYHLSYSQSEYASFEVPFKNAISISSIPDEKGNICYGFRFEKDYYFILLSKNKAPEVLLFLVGISCGILIGLNWIKRQR